MIRLRGYIDENGNKRFAEWLEGLDAAAAAKVTIALARMEQGSFSKVKGWGPASLNARSTSVPATAFTSARMGERLVILIGGGTKKRQQQDIATARECWAAYK